MKVNFHNPQRAISTEMTCASGDFTTLQFSKHSDEVMLYLTSEQAGMARAIAAIFNGDIPALVSCIDKSIVATADRHRIDIPETDFALAIACDLIGKDLDEALRERREAEDAA